MSQTRNWRIGLLMVALSVLILSAVAHAQDATATAAAAATQTANALATQTAGPLATQTAAAVATETANAAATQTANANATATANANATATANAHATQTANAQATATAVAQATATAAANKTATANANASQTAAAIATQTAAPTPQRSLLLRGQHLTKRRLDKLLASCPGCTADQGNLADIIQLATRQVSKISTNATALGLDDVGVVTSILAFTTTTMAPASKMLPEYGVDYTVAGGEITPIGNHSTETWVITYRPWP